MFKKNPKPWKACIAGPKTCTSPKAVGIRVTVSTLQRGREAAPMSQGCAGTQPQPKPSPLSCDLSRNSAIILSPRFPHVHRVMYPFPLPTDIFQQRHTGRANCVGTGRAAWGGARQVAVPPAPEPAQPHGRICSLIPSNLSSHTGRSVCSSRCCGPAPQSARGGY